MPVQSTLRLSSGYETDDSVPCRSGRITTPARQAPGMICPPSDSRQSLPTSSFTFSVNNRAVPAAKGKGKCARSESNAASGTKLGESDNDTDSPVILLSADQNRPPAPVMSKIRPQQPRSPLDHRNARILRPR
ncbi:uncharacterized protein MELLADRAFT_102801 [Melampsora larici-populina 98AG31]|uniref:Uncharacterized protein n=1 Tax=Melampsora larici-populina (strain 98AG31 / pathotype 3-4-7) TaxID=747676 RepID=F4R9F0_MELLP|nr:uncharacterized protein MELLADRAFT_102801 [Melampsora larici-populina 98AG31]EGG11165.1 hypothetical protein MELLADRAFT_102801 [Melampsora larici-populina 98AG31]